jgi:hypothetical protein
VLDGVRDQVAKRLGDPIGIALGEQIPFCRQLDRLSRMKGFFAGPPTQRSYRIQRPGR